MKAPRTGGYRLGIIGGLGPLASADLYARVTQLTPAARDQDHFPLVLVSIPQTPDRTAGILGSGPSPLPHLLGAVATLNRLEVELVAVACNTAHHWYEALSTASRAPILHIADAAIAELDAAAAPAPVMLLATRGVLLSGFYQKRLAARGYAPLVPEPPLQARVDAIIAAVKANTLDDATALLDQVLAELAVRGIPTVLLACTELPIAWRRTMWSEASLIRAIDTTEALARAAVRHLSGAWPEPGSRYPPVPAGPIALSTVDGSG